MARVVCSTGPESAGTLLSALIDGARRRLDVAVYEMTPYYAGLLRRAARRDVEVRLLLDAHGGANASTMALLAGTPVRVGVVPRHRGAEAHWKLVSADASVVAVGTGNLGRRDAPRDSRGRVPPETTDAGPGTREWWLIVEDAARLAATAKTAIEAAWAAAVAPERAELEPALQPAPPIGVPAPPVTPLRVGIRGDALALLIGGAAVAATLVERLAAVRRRALVTVPYVHPSVTEVRALLDGLGAARRRRADVRLLLGSPLEAEHAAAVVAAGIPVRVMDPARCTTGHAKGAVLDDTCVAGSANWSRLGLGRSREAALRVDDSRVADHYAGVLAQDWASSSRVGRS